MLIFESHDIIIATAGGGAWIHQEEADTNDSEESEENEESEWG